MCAVVPSPLCLYTYNGWECDEARCKRVSGEVRICLSQPETMSLCLSSDLLVCLSSSLWLCLLVWCWHGVAKVFPTRGEGEVRVAVCRPLLPFSTLYIVHCCSLPFSSWDNVYGCASLVTSPHLSLSWQKLTGWSGKARRLFVFAKWTSFHLLVVASAS